MVDHKARTKMQIETLSLSIYKGKSSTMVQLKFHCSKPEFVLEDSARGVDTEEAMKKLIKSLFNEVFEFIHDTERKRLIRVVKALEKINDAAYADVLDKLLIDDV